MPETEPWELNIADVQSDLEQAEEQLRGLAIIHGALMGGASALACAAVVVTARAWEHVPGAGWDIQINALTGVNVVLFVAAIGFALLVCGNMMRKAALAEYRDGWTVIGLLWRLRPIWIVRQAVLEGSGLLGLVVVFLAGIEGGLRSHPLYALNAVSALVFLIESALTFPTRDRLARLIVSLGAGTRTARPV